MIYTITLNPSIDYNVELDNLKEGTINLAENNNYHPGGKGINVSQVLGNLGKESMALGFIGGFTGHYIEEELKKRDILFDFVKIDSDTRINVKVKAIGSETEINGVAPKILDEDKKELEDKLEKLKDGDILILAGSVPSSLKETIYSDIIDKLPKGIKVVVDTKGDALVNTLPYKPFMVKPNHYELSGILKKSLNTTEEVIEGAIKLKELGAENVIVSMAGSGAILVNDSGVYLAKVPKGILKNSVGAGDSLVAGFVYGIDSGKTILEAFNYGIASGSATAFSSGLCSKEDVVNLLDQVKIDKLEG